MIDKEYLKELIKNDECEWIEFKENWFDKYELGEYISAISNSAAMRGEDYGYFIWGVNDKTHEIVGTDFNYDKDIKNEPLQHYLARLLTPSVNFEFGKFYFDDKKVVCLMIPAAKNVYTEFDKNRFIRIGSSKELLRKYPEREIDLAVILRNGLPTIINTPSLKQNLNFNELKGYYLSKGLFINNESFEENLSLFVPGTKKYNELAFILSDDNDITCRVSIFSGKKKSDDLYSLNDFGNKCILLTIDQINLFLDALNLNKVDETNRILERKDIPLFDKDCLREALLNAFIHNDWIDLNAPMISVFTDRIEILSYGTLPKNQTKIGFFAGKSKPRCKELAEIFLQLRISERSGRGVSKIFNKYGENAFDINEDFIKVTIPFAYENRLLSKESSNLNIDNTKSKKINNKKMILDLIKNDPSITVENLASLSKLSKATIQKYLKELTKENIIERSGNKRKGYWVIK